MPGKDLRLAGALVVLAQQQQSCSKAVKQQ
jgi:hypothetical protein